MDTALYPWIVGIVKTELMIIYVSMFKFLGRMVVPLILGAPPTVYGKRKCLNYLHLIPLRWSIMLLIFSSLKYS